MGSSYDYWTVKELKEALKERDLPVSGNKHVLIERLEDGPEGKTESELFIAGVVDSFVGVIVGMIVLTLIITFLVTGNPDQIERFESGALGVAIDDDNFVYVTQQDIFVKYSVIENDDGTLSLKEEYASPALGCVTHLFIEDNYVYAVSTFFVDDDSDGGAKCEGGKYPVGYSRIYMIEDSGHNFSVVSSTSLSVVNSVSDIVVSGDYAYISMNENSVAVYDVSNGFFDYVDRMLYSEGGHIKGLATNDEYLYALILSCYEPDSNYDENLFCDDYIYVWELDTIEKLAESRQLDGAVPVDSTMSMGGFLWFRPWYSSICANNDYVYLGDDGWGTGIVVMDFSDHNDPKKVHSYGRTIDEYPSGNYRGSGIAANDDFIVVSTAGEPQFMGGEGTSGSDDGVYIGKIDGDDDGIPLGKDAFPDWKYINSNWSLYAFLVLILGLPILISAGWSEIASQRSKKAEDRAEAEAHITKLKDTIDRLKPIGIYTTDLGRVLAQCEAEMEFSASPSFQKAGKLARKAVTEAEEGSFEHGKIQEEIDEIDKILKGFDKDGVDVSLSMTKMELAQTALSEGKFEEAWERLASARSIGSKLKKEYVESMKRIDQVKAKITEFKEKGINTDELEKILEKVETEIGTANWWEEQ